MSPANGLDAFKILASFIGAALGGVGAFLLKEVWLDRRKQQDREKQTRWLPLFAGAQDFKTRLDDLASKYEDPKNVWCEWTSSWGRTFRLPTEAQDFHELYLVDANPQVIDESFTLRGDPGGGSRIGKRSEEDKIPDSRAELRNDFALQDGQISGICATSEARARAGSIESSRNDTQ
jgi:hypothetical protein